MQHQDSLPGNSSPIVSPVGLLEDPTLSANLGDTLTPISHGPAMMPVQGSRADSAAEQDLNAVVDLYQNGRAATQNWADKVAETPLVSTTAQASAILASRAADAASQTLSLTKDKAQDVASDVVSSVRTLADTASKNWNAPDNRAHNAFKQQGEKFVNGLTQLAADVDDSDRMEQVRSYLGNATDYFTTFTDSVYSELGYVSAPDAAPLKSQQAEQLAAAELRLKENLLDLRDSPAFISTIESAFGEQQTPDEAEAIATDFASGAAAPKLEVVAAESLQGAAAYGDNTIFISEQYLDSSTQQPEALDAVLLEEAGHYIDEQLNRADSPGDEGAIFARLSQGEALSAAELTALKSENDHAKLRHNNQEIDIENFGFGNVLGGISNAASNAWNSVTDTASNTIDSFSSAASNTWDSVTDTASDTWNSVTDTASDTWDSFSDSASDTWNSVTDTASDTWDSFSDSASDTWNSVTDTASDTWDSVTDTTSDTWNSVTDTTSDTWNSVTDTASDTWNSVSDTASDTFSSAFDTTSDTLSNFGSAADSWKNFGLDDDADTFSSTLDTPADMLNDFGGASDSWKNFGLDAAEGISGAFDTASDTLNNFGSAAADTWHNVGSSALDARDNLTGMAADTWNNVADTASNALDKLAETTEPATDFVAEAVDTVTDTVDEVADTVAATTPDDVADAVETVTETIADTASTATDYVAETVDAASETTANAWNSVTETAANTWDNLTEAATTATENVADTATAATDAVIDSATADSLGETLEPVADFAANVDTSVGDAIDNTVAATTEFVTQEVPEWIAEKASLAKKGGADVLEAVNNTGAMMTGVHSAGSALIGGGALSAGADGPLPFGDVIAVPLVVAGGTLLIYDGLRDRANIDTSSTIDTGYDPDLDPNRANQTPPATLENLWELPGFPQEAGIDEGIGGFSEAPQDLVNPSIPGFGDGLDSVKPEDFVLDINFGKHLRDLEGEPPEDMVDPHAHHILYKKGRGAKQQELVQEGQGILRDAGIDPIYGPENLTWAPNRVAGQHGIEDLSELVEALRETEAIGGDQQDFADVLEFYGNKASRRGQ